MPINNIREQQIKGLENLAWACAKEFLLWALEPENLVNEPMDSIVCKAFEIFEVRI